jgi:hypothetical protein
MRLEYVEYSEVQGEFTANAKCTNCGASPCLVLSLRNNRRVGCCGLCLNSSWGDFVSENIDPKSKKRLDAETGHKQFMEARKRRMT